MSEQSSFVKRNFPRRVLLILPLVVFALVSLTIGFVASRTNRLSYKTLFFHLFFSEVQKTVVLQKLAEERHGQEVPPSCWA